MTRTPAAALPQSRLARLKSAPRHARLVALGTLMSLSAQAFAADPAPAVSSAGSLLQVFIGLVAVLLLIAGTAWVAKRLGVTQGGSSGLLHIISSASVGARERVVVVEIGESWLVVGVAPGSVNTLMTLPKGEIRPASPAALNPNFGIKLKQMIEARRAK